MFDTSPHSCYAPEGKRKQGGEISMRGEICTYQKCPKCKGNFARHRVSTTFAVLLCNDCQIQPTRYYLDIYHRGKRYKITRDERSNLLSSPDMANALLSEIRRRPQFDPSKYVRERLERYRMSHVIEAWLGDTQAAYRAGERSLSTLRGKEGIIRNHIADAFGDKDIRDIIKKDLSDFKRSLSGLKPNTRKGIVAQLNALLKYGYDELEIPGDAPKIKREQFQKTEIKTMTTEDQGWLLGAIEPYHQPIFRFMSLTGCRPAMARALQWSDIKWQEGKIVFQHNYSRNEFTQVLKNRKILEFPLIPEIQGLLKSLVRHISGHVFINSRTGKAYGEGYCSKDKILGRAFKATGIPYMPPKNVFRHSFATNLLESGLTTRDVSHLMGHSSEQTTRDSYDGVRIRQLGKVLEMGGKK